LKSHRPAKGLFLFCARACVEKTYVTAVAIITDRHADSAIQPGFFIGILHRPKDMPMQDYATELAHSKIESSWVVTAICGG
jgi:hypothetical protein